MDQVFHLSLKDFLAYIKTIDYGYKDTHGVVHIHTEEYDLNRNPYSFSSPQTVIKNNCAWCWDICELIRSYCVKNGIHVSTWFYEYQDDNIHQTHTQSFIQLEQLWFPVPDNSDPHDFYEFSGKTFDAVTTEFQGYFREFIRYLAKGNENNDAFLFREYMEIPEEGMTDEEVLSVLRGQ